jgi:hypothetical protein
MRQEKEMSFESFVCLSFRGHLHFDSRRVPYSDYRNRILIVTGIRYFIADPITAPAVAAPATART